MKIIVPLLVSLFSTAALCQQIDPVQTFQVHHVQQAVAVDKNYFYVINNAEIIKFDKSTGQQVGAWKDNSGHIKHLNSGVIIDDKLYCANSNYPEIPMASSIEIFDPVSLQPSGSHSFGIDIGSATWIDWFEGYWYVAFAHYTGRGGEPGKTNHWTQLVRYSTDWERVGGWVFPKDLIQRFGNYSNSGGVFTKEGKIYTTGHDSKELYVLELPQQGYTLKWVATLPAPFEGQGIAQDPLAPDIFYGISRSKNQVISGILKN